MREGWGEEREEGRKGRKEDMRGNEMEISVLLVLVWESRGNRRMSYTHVAAVLGTRIKCEKVDDPGEFSYFLFFKHSPRRATEVYFTSVIVYGNSLLNMNVASHAFPY